MASVTTLESQSKAQNQTEVKAPVRVERRALSETMDKVRAELDKVRSNPDPDNVHDLRVAIRRCRSVATVFEEVDPDAGVAGDAENGEKTVPGVGRVAGRARHGRLGQEVNAYQRPRSGTNAQFV